jgi:hypothetical protein
MLKFMQQHLLMRFRLLARGDVHDCRNRAANGTCLVE